VNGFVDFINSAKATSKTVSIVGARLNYGGSRKIGTTTLNHPFSHKDRGIWLNGLNNFLEA
jgi:hypothetical protein